MLHDFKYKSNFRKLIIKNLEKWIMCNENIFIINIILINTNHLLLHYNNPVTYRNRVMLLEFGQLKCICLDEARTKNLSISSFAIVPDQLDSKRFALISRANEGINVVLLKIVDTRFQVELETLIAEENVYCERLNGNKL